VGVTLRDWSSATASFRASHACEVKLSVYVNMQEKWRCVFMCMYIDTRTHTKNINIHVVHAHAHTQQHIPPQGHSSWS